MTRSRKIGIAVVVSLLVVVGGGIGAYRAFFHTTAEKAFSIDEETSTATDRSASDGPSDLVGSWSVGAGSEAGYRVVEDGIAGQNTVTGRTSTVTGEVAIESDGDEVTMTAATVTVDMASIASDQGLRDTAFRDTVMATSQFPTAVFTQSGDVAIADAGTGDAQSFTVEGTLAVRGETAPAVAKIEGVRSGDGITVVGTIDVTLADFGIDPPTIPNFITVQGTAIVEFRLLLGRT